MERRPLHRNGQDLHGHFFGQSSLATRALAPASSVIKVPREAPLEILGPLACGVQTGAQSVLHILRPDAGQTLAIFGAGGVGLSALIAAVNLTGATSYVVDVNPTRLALATQLGATHVVNARDEDPVAALMDLSGGRGIDRTLEATASRQSCARPLTSSRLLGCAASSAHRHPMPKSR